MSHMCLQAFHAAGAHALRHYIVHALRTPGENAKMAAVFFSSQLDYSNTHKSVKIDNLICQMSLSIGYECQSIIPLQSWALSDKSHLSPYMV